MPMVDRRVALALLVVMLAAVTVTSVMAASRTETTQRLDSSLPLKTAENTSPESASLALAPRSSLDDATLRESAVAPFANVASSVAVHASSSGSGVFSPATIERSLAAKPGWPRTPANPDPTGPPCDPWLVDEARHTVEDNAPALEGLSSGTLTSIASGDFDAASSFYSPDESVTEPLGSAWPPLVSATALPTVNVFLAEDSVVYFTYALVTWSDAGITSQHTVCIPMRFIDGAWYLTTFDDTTDGLEFVTSVQM